MLSSELKPQFHDKKKKKQSSFNPKSKISSTSQIQQKMQRLKEILQKQNLTHRTNKSSTLSSGSIISRKNRSNINGTTYRNLTKNNSLNQNSKQKYSNTTPNNEKPIKKVSSSRIESQLKSKLLQVNSSSPSNKNKKNNKKIFSYMNSSYEFDQLQKRLEKFRPTKSNQEHKIFKDLDRCDNIVVEDFFANDNVQREDIQGSSNFEQNQFTDRFRNFATSEQPITKINPYDVDNTDISTQFIQPSNSLANTQKFSLLNTQTFSITESSQLNPCILPLQSHQTTRYLNERKNISCLSNFSNFSSSYLKPIHEEDVWKRKILKAKENKEKQKNKNSKPMVSYSLLLSRRNKNKKMAVKFSDHLKYDNWLKIKKSCVRNKHINSKNLLNQLNHSGQKRNKSKRKESLSTLNKKRKGRSLSSCFKNKSREESTKKNNNTQSDTKNNLQSKILQVSPLDGKRTFKTLKEQNRFQKHIEKSLILSKSKSSTNYLSKLILKNTKTTRRGEQQISDNLTQKRNAIKQLHRKYQIEQLSFRLQQQLKKISSAINENSANKTGRKNNNNKQSANKLSKNKSSSQNKIKELSQTKQNHQLYQKALEFKLKISDQSKREDCLMNKRGFLRENDYILSNKQEQEKQIQPLKFDSQRYFDQQQLLNEFQQPIQEQNIIQNQQSLSLSDKSQSPLNDEVILIQQDEFDSPSSPKDQVLQQTENQDKIGKATQIEFEVSVFTNQMSQTYQQPQQKLDKKTDNNKTRISTAFEDEQKGISSAKPAQSHSTAPSMSLAKAFPIDIRIPQQAFYTNEQNQLIFKNSSYEQFIKVYSSLLIEIAHHQNYQITKHESVSSLLHSLTRPLGTSTINMLKMMAENHRQSKNASSIVFDSVNENYHEGTKESNYQQIEESNYEGIQQLKDKWIQQQKWQQNEFSDSILKESILLQSRKKDHIQEDDPQTPYDQYLQEEKNETSPEYIISPQIYYDIQSAIITYLKNYQINSPQSIEHNDSDDHEHIIHLNQFHQLINLIIKIYQPANQNPNSLSITEFYQQYLNYYSLAVYDLSNTILDELRPYGSKGVPPISFFHLQNHQPKDISSIKHFVSQKLTQEVFSIKLGLIVDNIQCHKPKSNNFTLSNQRFLSSHQSSQDVLLKTQKLTKVIKKYLQRQAKLINFQLQLEYTYLQDVKFQILYDIWTQIQSHILEQETQLLIDLLF